MKIGICTIDFEKIYKALPADELFAKIKNLGFEVVQLSFPPIKELGFVSTAQFEIPDKISGSIIQIINDASKKYDIPVVACNGTFNMAHPDISVRDEGIQRFEVIADTAKKLGCSMISLCTGTRCKNHMWTYHEDNNTPQAWTDMIYTVRKAAAIAEKYDIFIIAETEASNIVNTPEKARKMMDEVKSPKLKMIMDCANLFQAGEAKKDNVTSVITHAFEVFGRDVVSAHGKDIQESEGIKFCATGEGIVDYKLFIELLNKYGFIGDMILHGISDEEKMVNGIGIIKSLADFSHIVL